MSLNFILNQHVITTEQPASRSVLDLLRGELALTATKEGCHEGDCGACSILLGTLRDGVVEYRAVNSCLLPLGTVAGHHLVTVEGLTTTDKGNPIQQALVEEGGVQCGFCSPGMVVALTGYLLNAPRLDATAAVEALDGNLCRCTGYMGIRRAAARLETLFPGGLPPKGERVAYLITLGVLPPYFAAIPQQLATIPRPGLLPLARPITVAGGTDLFSHPNPRLQAAALHFLSEDEGWQGIHIEDGECHIGAATTIETLLESALLAEHLPHWHQHLARIASTPVRDRATVAGNLVNASPIGDLTILLLALDARLLLEREGAQRELPLAGFFLGYKQLALKPDELVREIIVPVAESPLLFNFEKVALRDYLDIATVNTALSLQREGDDITSVRLSAGGVGAVPMLLPRTATALEEGPLSREQLQRILNLAMAEVDPIDDVHGSAEYKRRLLRRLILAHLLELVPDLVAELVSELVPERLPEVE